jgi:hypothetical protein
MKINIILIAIVVLFATACNTDRTRSFIPGTYVNSATGEYSMANDTLVIEAAEGNNFFIHRKTGFKRITNGKPGKQEYETEEWNAIYDEGTKAMTEIRGGKMITFYPDANKLMVMSSEYQKIGK